LDVVLATIALVVVSPVALVVAAAIRLTMGSPILFRQVRPGLHGKPFVMYKFRTMLDLRDEQGNLLPDEERLTRLGKFLRHLSLDEIPELWNVLKGDMSAVGPRPLLMEYLPLYTPEQARRHEVKPGMAGPVIMSGRNILDWEEKFKLDVWYVDNRNFRLDAKILFFTFLKVLKGEGVSSPGYETMPKFTGTGTWGSTS
jgi:lipopolysaccharide/colanic/teichoic acid biosynthesis glycosyltransferase